MTNVVKRPIERGVRDRAWGRLLAVVKTSKSPEALKKNLAAFLTPEELVMLEKRLAIPLLVKKGLSYRQIGELLDVSPNTISFAKHHLLRSSQRARS